MNVPEAAPTPPHHPNLEWLFGLQRFGMRTGLEVTQALLSRLGSPHLAFDTVLVGGTNGKGSVARVLAACLQASGARTGLFTSPHLQRVGERARVAGESATDADMERLVAAVRPEASAVGATFFEVVTAACLLRFVEASVDVAVLEVGLGGRLDATNVAAPDLTIVTGVALDHTAVLGGTPEAIAAEKAGILRPSVPLITGAAGGTLEVLYGRAEELGAPVHVLGHDFSASEVTTSWGGTSFTLEWRASSHHGVPALLRTAGSLQLRSPLVGGHQASNVALAAYGALRLGAPAEAVQQAVAVTHWPGRLEAREYSGRRTVLDGAHNPQAARALASSLAALEGQAAVLVVGMSEDKAVAEVLTELRAVARHVIFTRATSSPRSAAPQALLETWGAVGTAPAELASEPAAALRRAVQLSQPGQTVVVAGSLFLVAEVSDLLDGVEGETYERWQ